MCRVCSHMICKLSRIYVDLLYLDICSIKVIMLYITYKHITNILALDNRPNKLTTESILDGIQICKINEYKELLVFIHQLDDIIYKMDNVSDVYSEGKRCEV